MTYNHESQWKLTVSGLDVGFNRDFELAVFNMFKELKDSILATLNRESQERNKLEKKNEIEI